MAAEGVGVALQGGGLTSQSCCLGAMRGVTRLDACDMSKRLASRDVVNHQLWKEHLPTSLTACRVLRGLGKDLV